MKKFCRICGFEKDINDFHKKSSTKDGYRNECKECVKEIQKKYKEDPSYIEKQKEYDKKRYEENRDIILEQKKIHHQKNKDTINTKKRKYYSDSKIKDKHNKWMSDYSKNPENKEVVYRYRRNNPHIIAWRSLLYSTLKRIGKKKESHTIDELGYSAEDLKIHIENKFTPGMSWDNHGEWHIDHIIPVSYFTKDVPVSLVCGLSNLQPLWSTTRDIDGVIYEGNLNKSNN
jgi:hypothetical protein